MAGLELPRRNKTKEFEKLKDAAVQARLPFDKDMLLNLAFFLDHQYTEWVAEANMVRAIPRSATMRNAPRPVSNKIMHFVMQEHAFALSNRPSVDVLPASEDPRDISAANVALAYLRWLAEPQVGDFNTELSDATFWALVAGEGYIKWVYNSREQRPDFLSVSPLDVYADPFATKFNKARWVIHEQFMDVQEVEDKYGKKVKETAADADRAALLREMGQAPVLRGAVVNELWVRPGGKRYPQGLFVVWSGKDILVEPQPFPYRHGQLPFSQLGCIPRPKTPHYTCPVKYLRSPQMELNKYHAQKLMSREAFANPKWWIPAELELEQDPNDSPRQILRGQSQGGTLRPEIIQGEVMRDPGDGEWIRQEMQDVVGLHEVSQGQVPGRVEAAKAIQALKESDQSRLFQLEETIKTAIAQGWWQCLMLAKQFVSEEKIVQTYSPEGYPEVHRFKSDKISPSMRVRVMMGTGLSGSRAARTEQAMLLWQNGVIQDPEIFAEITEIPVESIAPQRAYDIRLARNENLEIAGGDKGVAIRPNSWDDHDVHIREHNNYRKTSDFSALSKEHKQKFEFHVKMHEEMLLAYLQSEAEKAMVAQGMPPQPEEDPAAAEDPTAAAAGDPTAASAPAEEVPTEQSA